jgi:DDE_Tnp_1-associated
MSIPSQTTTSPTALIETHFGTLQDPRALHSLEHKLIDIVIITICGTICGADIADAISYRGD